ncbi:anti-sigma factor family protein [Geothrix fuzhouensis]|uniref:anti-sigma factor family protein n=1 Tax=Geothrix fuzhouensis TaxID=2966451 RepID=UPI002148978E|nr:zf-HC2 domain-containing protein [Geothrix fuzhouensis]
MTTHVLDQLPLWVGGDLEAAEMAAVDRHMEGCPTCRAASEDLRASQAWTQEAMASPFGAADHARLRRAVMDRVVVESRPRPRSPRMRPSLLAAAAALLLASLTWALHQPRPATPVPVTGPAVPAPAPQDPKPAPPLPHPAFARVAPAPARAEPPTTPTGPTRIEFQTADPTIRIIWLAQAKPLPETESSTEKP